MAAEQLAGHGLTVTVYDAMPSVGRKLLMAGKGGLNISHSEPFAAFVSRYGATQPRVLPWLTAFSPSDLQAWVHDLGITTFVGSSGRIFPEAMKAAPLLRAWLHRLRQAGVQFQMRQRWLGWDADEGLLFQHGDTVQSLHADAVVLALGGGSWPQLGATGAWQALLADRGVAVRPLKPSNCGFDCLWSDHFRQRYAGQPIKALRLGLNQPNGAWQWLHGEVMLTEHGIEGGAVYALSAALRDHLERDGTVTLYLDLLPDCPHSRLQQRLSQPRQKQSFSNVLRKSAGISGVKAALLQECLPDASRLSADTLAHHIKQLPLTLVAPRPLAEAISSAGGVAFTALDPHLMLQALPGVFCAGEMIDWEAPTGGYLLSGCWASGRAAGQGALRWLQSQAPADLL